MHAVYTHTTTGPNGIMHAHTLTNTTLASLVPSKRTFIGTMTHDTPCNHLHANTLQHLALLQPVAPFNDPNTPSNLAAVSSYHLDDGLVDVIRFHQIPLAWDDGVISVSKVRITKSSTLLALIKYAYPHAPKLPIVILLTYNNFVTFVNETTIHALDNKYSQISPHSFNTGPHRTKIQS